MVAVMIHVIVMSTGKPSELYVPRVALVWASLTCLLTCGHGQALVKKAANCLEAQVRFQSIDTNGDGILDALELSAGLCDSGLTDNDIDLFVVDQASMQEYDRREAAKAAKKKPKKKTNTKILTEPARQVLATDFARFDKDGAFQLLRHSQLTCLHR